MTWFDLAPVYGAGQAEAIAAPFLRATATRCRSPPRRGSRSAACAGGLRAALMPLARAGGAAGPLRRALAPRHRQRQAGADAGAPDILARSEPPPARHRPGRTLRAARGEPRGGRPRRHPPGARGHPRRRQGAGGRGGERRGCSRGGARHRRALLGDPDRGAGTGGGRPAGGGAPRRRASGGSPTRSSASARPGRRCAGGSPPTRRRRRSWRAEGGDAEAGLATALLGSALAANPDGVVLVSMLSARSRALNLAAAARPPAGAEAGLARLLAGA